MYITFCCVASSHQQSSSAVCFVLVCHAMCLLCCVVCCVLRVVCVVCVCVCIVYVVCCEFLCASIYLCDHILFLAMHPVKS